VSCPSPDFTPVKDSELPNLSPAYRVGPVNPNETAEVALLVRHDPNNESLDSVVEALSTRSVSGRQYLSRQEFAQAHSADPADIDTIEQFASEYGLSVAGSSPSQRMVRVTGTLANLSKAFNVPLAMYRTGRTAYRAHLGPVSVPNELADKVEGVFGLDTRPQGTHHFQRPRGTRSAYAPPGILYTPVQVASLYGFPAGLTGQGQCIGIIEFGGGYRTSDLDEYFQEIGIDPPSVVSVSVLGAVNYPTTPMANNGDDVEVMLDIEVAGGVAPGAQIVVYFAPIYTLGWLRAFKTAIHDSYHNPSVISVSWGGPESTWTRQALRALNDDFKAAAAMGVTICTPAGDNGYTDGLPGSTAHVDFPGSSPYSLCCGGTSLRSTDSTISSETVWNDGPNPANPTSATGGGVSAFFAVPSYQNSVDVPPSVNPPYNPGRGVPDVAGVADPNTGYKIRVDGVDLWTAAPPIGGPVGGTSAVAPLWAGLIALINEQLGNSVGFINPLLYSQGAEGGGLHDITSGNNGAYKAGPGWDPCTGLGSPDGTTLAGLL
jgi:kumamolisin